MAKLNPLIKCFGGQFYFRNWIISKYPPDYQNYSYLESCIGGGSVFLNKKPSINGYREIINDLDWKLMSIYKVVKYFLEEFVNRLQKIKYNQETFKLCLHRDKLFLKEDLNEYINDDNLELDIAVNEYCLRRMSRAGLRKDFAWSERLRGGIPGDVNAWNNSIKQLKHINKRLSETWIFNKNVIDLLYSFAHFDKFLFYLDPPFLHETRKTKNAYGQYEMDEKDHIKLLELLPYIKGKVLLSGYMSPLYDKYLKNWNCHTKEAVNNSGQSKKKTKRLACLWTNY